MSTSIESLTRDHEHLLGALTCLQHLANRGVEGLRVARRGKKLGGCI